MQDHLWIMTVCEELADQAAKQGKTKIVAAAQRAIRIARSEVGSTVGHSATPMKDSLKFVQGVKRLRMGQDPIVTGEGKAK